MAVQSYSIEINQVNLYKFATLSGGLNGPDGKETVNIYPQVNEITIYESLFSPIIKCEIAIIDYIGLFTNFPLTGNEIIEVRYKNVGDINSTTSGTPRDKEQVYLFAIESINDINIDDTNRAVGYIIKCVALEGLANVLKTVKQAYMGSYSKIAQDIWREHIVQRIKTFFPKYKPLDFNVSDSANNIQDNTFVVANHYPITAINIIQRLMTTSLGPMNGSVFYQTSRGFNLRFLQELTQNKQAREYAENNDYVYLSNEIPIEVTGNTSNADHRGNRYLHHGDDKTNLENQERLVSKMWFNKRHSALQKLSVGYFNNNLFEINLAQRTVKDNRTFLNDVQRMSSYGFDTKEFNQYADSAVVGQEDSNRTHYRFTTRPDSDPAFPLFDIRERWGKDIISKVALSQVDITVVIPGTNRFVVGDLFYLHVPDFHGFDQPGEDKLITGYFLITEIKHIIQTGGFQSTVMRLNKDSYNQSVDVKSNYGGDVR